MDNETNVSFGVFKPVGHVLISFPSAQQAADARRALGQLGVAADRMRAWTDREMIEQIDHDMRRASPLASVGQELNLIKAHRALAEQGYHWLLVHAPDDDAAKVVAQCVRGYGAERAQHFGHFVIEELIQHATDGPQVAESPDRGLDPNTPSGEEAERSTLRPAPGR